MNNKKAISLLALMFTFLAGCQFNSTTNSETSNSSVVTTTKKEIKSISISNKSELTKDWYVGASDRLIKISLKSTGIALETALSDGTITITSSNPSVVQVNEKKIKALANGKSTITVAAGNIKDSVEVEVSDLKYENPTIILDVYDDEEFSVLSGNSLALPYVTCVDNYGNDLSSYIRITSDLDPYAEINKSHFFSTVEGEHTLTYTVVHPEDKTKVSSTTLKVTVYRNILKGQDGTFSIKNSYGPNEEQIVESSNKGYALAKLNMSASNNYYVETTVVMPTSHHGGHCVGLTHYNPEDEGKFMLATVDMGDYNYKWTEFDTTLPSWRINDQDVWSWRLGEYRGLDIQDEDTEFKLAVARLGRHFYTFVNDEYVGMYTEAKYSDVDTYVGLFALQPNEGIKFSKVNYFTGQKAVSNKIDEITNKGAGMISSYVPDSWALESLNTNNKNFIVNPYSKDRGINFDFTNTKTNINDGMVSLYQYFDGTFSFEFDYKKTAANTEPGNQFMYLEVRPRNYSREILHFATKFNGGPNNTDIEQHTKFRVNHSDADSAMQETWNTNITDYSEGCHYKLTRVLGESNSKFIMEVYSIADPSQKVTVEKTYSSDYWNDQLVLLWHNTNVAGEYSNISWYSTK